MARGGAGGVLSGAGSACICWLGWRWLAGFDFAEQLSDFFVELDAIVCFDSRAAGARRACGVLTEFAADPRPVIVEGEDGPHRSLKCHIAICPVCTMVFKYCLHLSIKRVSSKDYRQDR